jgi:hypothetical protein
MTRTQLRNNLTAVRQGKSVSLPAVTRQELRDASMVRRAAIAWHRRVREQQRLSLVNPPIITYIIVTEDFYYAV